MKTDKIHVKSASIRCVEDNYKTGETDNSFCQPVNRFLGVYDSLTKFCKEHFLFKLDNFDVEDNKLTYVRIEDVHGNEVEVDSEKWERFKKDECSLYNVYFEFGIELIKTFEPSEKQLNAEIEYLSLDENFK